MRNGMLTAASQDKSQFLKAFAQRLHCDEGAAVHLSRAVVKDMGEFIQPIDKVFTDFSERCRSLIVGHASPSRKQVLREAIISSFLLPNNTLTTICFRLDACQGAFVAGG